MLKTVQRTKVIHRHTPLLFLCVIENYELKKKKRFKTKIGCVRIRRRYFKPYDDHENAALKVSERTSVVRLYDVTRKKREIHISIRPANSIRIRIWITSRAHIIRRWLVRYARGRPGRTQLYTRDNAFLRARKRKRTDLSGDGSVRYIIIIIRERVQCITTVVVVVANRDVNLMRRTAVATTIK